MDVRQTKVTADNRQEFFNQVYGQRRQFNDALIDLDQYDVDGFVIVDCCSWEYKQLYPNSNIIGLETGSAITEYALDQSLYQGVIDNEDFYNIKWPHVCAIDKSALIFDYSPMLKYRTTDNIVKLMSDAAETYQSKFIVMRTNVAMIDDSRLGDRLTNLSKLLIPNYVVTEFLYNTLSLKISYKRNKFYD